MCFCWLFSTSIKGSRNLFYILLCYSWSNDSIPLSIAFSCLCIIEKALFSGQIFEMEILMVLQVFHCIFLPMYRGENIVLGSNFRNGDFDGLTRFQDP